jgi:hypothetical protein
MNEVNWVIPDFGIIFIIIQKDGIIVVINMGEYNNPERVKL